MNILLDAIAFSNVIALLSLGLTLTYMTLKVPNFAHGDLATLGAYAALVGVRFLNLNPYTAIPLAFLISGAVSLASYLAVYRPLSRRGANIVMLMIASMAVEVALRSSLHIFADVMTSRTKTYWRGFFFKDESPAGVPPYVLASTLMVAAVSITLFLMLTKTKFGVALRAAVENPQLASTVGIDVEKAYAFSWMLAGGLAGAAGVFIPYRTPTDPETGWALLLRVFAASVLGGLDQVFGAIVGGYMVGLPEILGIYLLSGPPFNLSTAYRPVIPFTIFVLVLLLAPRGVFGVEWKRLLGRVRKNV